VRHVELVVGIIGDMRAWDGPGVRAWVHSSSDRADMLYWNVEVMKGEEERRCIHGLTHKGNNFVTLFEGADGLIFARCYSQKCEKLGAMRALGAARHVQEPPAIHRS